jgi:quinol monooxygenase YgiN
MIIVWGSVEAADEGREEKVRLSLAHVSRSRAEPGCINHNVSIDAENRNRLNFYEEWEDLEALHTHFRVPGSIAFVAKLGKLCVRRPEMRSFDATRIE